MIKEMGTNRTGIELSPVDKRLLIEGAEKTVPSMAGDDTAIDMARAEYLKEHEKLGSMPPPTTVRGMAGSVVDMVKGVDMTLFLDKIGERLAFERTGTRLYAAMLAKFDASEPIPGGPTRAELQKIHDDEHAHFLMLREAILTLGADPTAMTPSADVQAVASMGLIKVVSDPRMNLAQSLEALLTAELVDNDSWVILTELAQAAGHTKLADRFRAASAQEAEHLVITRNWVRAVTLASAAGVNPTSVRAPASA